MRSEAKTAEEYLSELSDERRLALSKLRDTVKTNLPEGFEEVMNYGMIGYVVPHSLYPAGYHCNPELPLPFINIASQKQHIGLYHMGIYADEDLLQWFIKEYPNHSNTKLDMGKSCIRFKKIDAVPYKLIGELCSKIQVRDWITMYESQVKR